LRKNQNEKEGIVMKISMKKIFLFHLIVTLYGGTLFCMDNTHSNENLLKLGLESGSKDSKHSKNLEDDVNDSDYIPTLKNEEERSDYISELENEEERSDYISELENEEERSDYISALENEEEINENDSEILKSLSLIHTKIKQINLLKKLEPSELLLQKRDQFIKDVYENTKKVILLIKQIKNDDENFKKVIKEMENISFDLQKYIEGSRALTAQHLALVLNNILPLIAAIQNVAQVNITMQMNNPIPNKKSIFLSKKIIIVCLALSTPVVVAVWYLGASGLAVTEIAVSLKDFFIPAIGFLLT
jgi:hypothetical protein